MVVIYDEEMYRKQSPRNHFEILTSNGRLMITFPVQKPWRNKKVGEVRLDHNQKWIRNHWKSVRTAYGKAPFFEVYAPLFEDLICNPPDLLIDLNMQLLRNCLKGMKLRREILKYSDLNHEFISNDAIQAELSGAMYWDVEFGKPADELSYNQLFGNEFVQGLSILDLMFNHGPESVLYLRQT